MDRSHQLLLNVWREACRHIEIADSLDRIASLLQQQLPLGGLLLRQISTERKTIETVAATLTDQVRLPREQSRVDCNEEQLGVILKWLHLQQIWSGDAQQLHRDLPGVLPKSTTGGRLLAGPLRTEHGHLGVLVLLGSNEVRLAAQHEILFQALLEPFTAALENDRRLHELVTLRERVEAENRNLMSKLGRSGSSDIVIGAESGLQEVMERVALVSKADVPVLILGETGSGKEVVARTIHRQSRRAEGPFLRVNCGAIPPELIDSELFGHEKGSFTGAATQRKGWFERADGGTLFLDECGELPLAAQVRLLRVLQDGSFERVGGERTLHVDVRIVAATHRDLKTMVKDRTFREDLWYRLAVFPVHLPPLRDRRQDIAAMASHFATRAAVKLGLRPCTPTVEEIRLLQSYAWPGNVRELASVMERAAILGDGTHLDVAHALGSATAPEPELAALDLQERTAMNVVTKFASLDEAMVAHIRSALEHAKGRIEGPHGAARLLGINPHTLRSRMRKLGLDWQRYRSE